MQFIIKETTNYAAVHHGILPIQTTDAKTTVNGCIL